MIEDTYTNSVLLSCTCECVCVCVRARTCVSVLSKIKNMYDFSVGQKISESCVIICKVDRTGLQNLTDLKSLNLLDSENKMGYVRKTKI